ncbi:P-loop containing nucleoside triphosphate hydrolase protein [Neocallimastix lanati (nom. inval.)]|uniref:p-loop containing nucleoside triphosphate hydrolase protein n=1 Tax=Neocallimastix californiae TaxID=1754190 RepID=A0A1Y2C560_9FUNG|nr:P-loop containing nucleoside triphosphate hydrolase protein [Neocallimastix sp. JGI-2020a]ORY42076.1 P-loop containing nucleoside triphosphate hydrolase protein [Neocallimastix californiae]|eukprot:ORY42076.1 P-loop containing nucleoside triphosphate hydrolase protein [Neocallimastix californiae]
MAKASLILIGETGNGKSSLGNFILKKNVFPVSDNPESETKITRGEHGGNNVTDDIFVIDTPGLMDAEGTDKEHLIQMVDYIKSNPGLQGIVIVFNFHQPKLPMNIRTLIMLLCNVFPRADFWRHVALVWTKFYSCLSQKQKDKKDIAVNKFMPKILDLVKETHGDISINSFPTFFVDSDPEENDEFSNEEISRLIAWVHTLTPIDVTKVQEADPNIEKIEEEEDIRESKTVEGNVEHIKLEYFKRNKEIHYDDSITYSDWVKVKEEEKENVLPRKLLREEIETKEEKHESSTPKFAGGGGGSDLTLPGALAGGVLFGGVGVLGGALLGGALGGGGGGGPQYVGNEVKVITDYYRRTVRIYNDNTVEYGNWEKYDSKVSTF